MDDMDLMDGGGFIVGQDPLDGDDESGPVRRKERHLGPLNGPPDLSPMDFLTHTLVGVGIARVVIADRKLLPQFALAAILGSTLIDGDSFLALLGSNVYGKYHRVITHSLLGLVLVGGGLSTVIARWASSHPAWRRFGWFVVEKLPATDPIPERVGAGRLYAVAFMAACAHWIGDWITGFGGLKPLWPFGGPELVLAATFSFDAFLFSWTLAWHVLVRWLNPPLGRERVIGVVWLLVVVGYVAWRAVFLPKTFW